MGRNFFREKIKIICKLLVLGILLSDTSVAFNLNENLSSLSDSQENITPIDYADILKEQEIQEKIEILTNNHMLKLQGYEAMKDAINSRPIYDEIPLMFQTDYPDVKFGGRNVATSGCSISCLAMVATYLTDTEYTPGYLGEKYRKAGKDNCKCMEAAATDLGLEWKKSFDWDEMIEALKNNQPVIVMVKAETVFTDEAHLIVLTKIDENGRIWVNDPYEPNYKPNRCIKGFNEGFKQWEILTGLSGGWIFQAKEDTKANDLAEINELIRIENNFYQSALKEIYKQGEDANLL